MDYETGKEFEKIWQTLTEIVEALQEKGILEKPKEAKKKKGE